MGCCENSDPVGKTVDTAALVIALAGNPNCGKSALFNDFTGIRQKTGNWPGVTVDRKEGRFQIDGHTVTAYDLPGIYSLDANSLDEQVTRDYLLSRDASLIVNVIDATNLERNLYLSVQLLEMGVPLVVALNMMDVARKRGIDIDTKRLAEELGCPVVPVVAVTGEGLQPLKQAILDVALEKHSGGYCLAQDETVEQGIVELLPLLEKQHPVPRSTLHWFALKLLEGDQDTASRFDTDSRALAQHWRQTIEDRAGEDADIHIADSRYGHAHALAQTVLRQKGQLGHTLTDRIDKLVLSRLFGIPVFLCVMYLMFMFTINIGGAFVDFFDGIAAAIFVDGFGKLLTDLGAPTMVRVILADGIGGGIQIVATFIPIIAALYLILSAIEDSGYMARAAFVMDRFMRSIGLPGKSFVPLIVGFGCNVPAVMATRTLENERERKLTILMNPFMSCGARLPVYALFAAAFFPSNGQNVVFALYLTGIAVAVLTGLVMKRTILTGESTGFMMELPPYHLPTLKGMLLRTWDRVRLFIKEAGQVIVVMVLIINLLNSIGTDGSFGNENSDHSVLSVVSQSVTPVFSPLGVEQDNWPAVLGILSGVLAKEVVVGTLDTLYSQMAREDAGLGDVQKPFDFWSAIVAASNTVPDNLSAVGNALLDPLKLNVGNVSDLKAAAQEQAVHEGTFGAMVKRFDGQAGAFAYLLFILLYIPCVATIGAIRREAGSTWAGFVAIWTTLVAYMVSSGYYQLVSFARHPWFSALWLASIVLVFIAIVVGLRIWSRRGSKPVITAEVNP